MDQLPETFSAGLSLTDGFEEKDGGGNGSVEGIQASEHRNADVFVGRLPPSVCQARGFGTDHDGCAMAPTPCSLRI